MVIPPLAPSQPSRPYSTTATQSNNPKSKIQNPKGGTTDLRDTLAVLATEENSPCDAAGVLALEEQRLGLSVLETEDLAVTTDEQLTLKHIEY
jgi:hypothetical protein